MKISGFTFIRNGNYYGYPFIESIKSLLPLCDEVVVAIGNSDDKTREDIVALNNPKIVLIDTVWDDTLRSGGKILAQQTDVALAHTQYDWCLYLQGDEVLHEGDYDIIKNEMLAANTSPDVEALLFRWRHFFGSYEYIGVGRQWYRREIRAFKRNTNVVSWGDAQGFKVKTDDGGFRKLRAKQTEARIFHYGWVRHPHTQTKKFTDFNRLWHDDEHLPEVPKADEFDYRCYESTLFKETHPLVMAEKIQRDKHWTSAYDPTRRNKRPFMVWLTDSIEKATGFRIGEYKNFVEVK